MARLLFIFLCFLTTAPAFAIDCTPNLILRNGQLSIRDNEGGRSRLLTGDVKSVSGALFIKNGHLNVVDRDDHFSPVVSEPVSTMMECAYLKDGTLYVARPGGASFVVADHVDSLFASGLFSRHGVFYRVDQQTGEYTTLQLPIGH